MAQEDKSEKEPVDRQREEAEAMARLQEEISNLPVSDHLVYMMQSLSALAVSRLGLAADAAERRDLGQARLAIDAFKAILGVLEQARPVAELAAHRGMLSQLQLTFAAAISKPSADDRPQPTAEKPEAPPAGGDTPGGREKPATDVVGAKASAKKAVAPGKKAAAPKKAAAQKTRKPRGSSQTGS